jgi:hypothetical protein
MSCCTDSTLAAPPSPAASKDAVRTVPTSFAPGADSTVTMALPA